MTLLSPLPSIIMTPNRLHLSSLPFPQPTPFLIYDGRMGRQIQCSVLGRTTVGQWCGDRHVMKLEFEAFRNGLVSFVKETKAS